ncbi:hypothetical protein ABIA35_009589 [Catenulispora sp. MAP12-49]|uniref:cell wall-binding repeat-containing protein n=1 Tax=Catenulispora sp. MAP12-49 TaxID=3156302 RepID=UPI003519B583
MFSPDGRTMAFDETSAGTSQVRSVALHTDANATANAETTISGAAWPDALSGGAAMGTRGGPLLLVNPATGLSGQDVALLDANRAELYSGFVFGGTAPVPAGIDKQLGQAIAGPLGAVDGSGHRLAASSGVGGVGGAGGAGGVGSVGVRPRCHRRTRPGCGRRCRRAGLRSRRRSRSRS